MLRVEPNVRIRRFTPALQIIFDLAAEYSSYSGVGVVVNSVDDGTHGKITMHGLSAAADLDTESDTPAELEGLYQFMRRKAPIGFDVLYEVDHVHIEQDPHRAEARIPKTV